MIYKLTRESNKSGVYTTYYTANNICELAKTLNKILSYSGANKIIKAETADSFYSKKQGKPIQFLDVEIKNQIFFEALEDRLLGTYLEAKRKGELDKYYYYESLAKGWEAI